MRATVDREAPENGVYFPPMSSAASQPLYLKIANNVEGMIDAGTLRPGDRIPSVRNLSCQHKVSAPTVLQAYMILESRRLIEAKPRSGFYVRSRLADGLSTPTLSRRTPHSKSLSKFPPLMSLVNDVTTPDFVRLGGANPSPELLPARKLARIIGSVSRQYPLNSINYDPVPGCPRLRAELSRRSMDWGCYLEPDQFVITTGATEGLHLALAAVTKPGDTVMVESPTYYGLLSILSHLRLRAIAIPSCSREGINLAAAHDALTRKRISAIVVIPNFSNPNGSLMPETNRSKLLAMALKHRLPIIEDDIYGDLSHLEDRPRALKALDEEGNVILCGSFSKTLAPGYRVGYLAPGRHRDKILEIKTALSFGSSPLSAMAIAEFLRNGGYDHHLRTLRRTFRGQVLKMRDALASALPKEIKISNPSGGFVLWVELPVTVDALLLFQQARERQISIAPGQLFSPAAEFKNFIRISCGYPWTPRIEEAVTVLGNLVQRHPRDKSMHTGR